MSLWKTTLLAAAGAVLCLADEYRFAPSPDVEIRLEVSFPKPYNGSRLVFYSGDQEQCFSAETGVKGCTERFVGAAALVQYTVKGAKRKNKAIRESVSVTGQSPDLPERPVFEKSVPLVDGRASDVQLFGYEEDADTEAARLKEREDAAKVWRRYRQELFLGADTRPFAVLEWHHTIQAIRLDRIEAPGR
ncbi:MAG: hypothetical protein JST93_13560 [Acidobacteria bacterium]|nr:hypothetical protein [Acidobacteriota bacterium]